MNNTSKTKSIFKAFADQFTSTSRLLAINMEQAMYERVWGWNTWLNYPKLNNQLNNCYPGIRGDSEIYPARHSMATNATHQYFSLFSYAAWLVLGKTKFRHVKQDRLHSFILLSPACSG